MSHRVTETQDTGPRETYHDWPENLRFDSESLADVGGVKIKRFECFALEEQGVVMTHLYDPLDACLLYTSPSPRD